MRHHNQHGMGRFRSVSHVCKCRSKEHQMKSRLAWSLRVKALVVGVVTCVSVCATLPATASATGSTTTLASHSAKSHKTLTAAALGGIEETLLTKFATSIVTSAGGKIGGVAAGW